MPGTKYGSTKSLNARLEFRERFPLLAATPNERTGLMLSLAFLEVWLWWSCETTFEFPLEEAVLEISTAAGTYLNAV